MISYILLLISLLCLPLDSNCLTEGETSALKSILSTWPSLGTRSPPWVEQNISHACDKPFAFGLNCSEGPDPHVIGVFFYRANLNGPMPSALSRLPWLESLAIISNSIPVAMNPESFTSPSLRSLEFSNNDLIGPIPDTIWTHKYLKFLTISQPRLATSISPQIEKMTSLEHFSLVTNEIEGMIPPTIGNLKRLKYLNFNFHISGTIPLELGNLTSLEELHLSAMSGPLPSTIGQLKELRHIELDLKSSIRSNNEPDTLPEEFGSLKSLEELTIKGDIFGHLPHSIGRMKHLRVITITESSMSGPLPPEIGQLSSLEEFEFSLCRSDSLGLGTIPPEIGNLTRLKKLQLNCRLSGTIPSSIAGMERLEKLALQANSLEGTIPTLPRNLLVLDLSQNLLTDWFDDNPLPFINPREFTVKNNRLKNMPRIIIDSQPWSLDVSYNHLSGTLPDDFFIKTGSGRYDFSSNRLTGTLPTQLSKETLFNTLQLSNNDFYGPIPAIYGTLSLNLLILDNNNLSGNLEGWDEIRVKQELVLSAENNQLSGQLVPLGRLILRKLYLSRNKISGSLPNLPEYLSTLDLSHNRLQSFGDNHYDNLRLTNIDLSHNQITGTIPHNMISRGIISLNMKNNSISGTIPWSNLASQLVNLDLSFNQISGELPSTMASGLRSLNLRSNQMTGQSLGSFVFPNLIQLDIAQNLFELHLSVIGNIPNLISLEAADNRIQGSPTELARLSSIKMADLSGNQLNEEIDLEQLHMLFTSSLRQLYINDNPKLIHLKSQPQKFGPWRTAQTQPSFYLPGLVDCYSLTFDNDSSTLVFVFDEDLFNWSQCDCMDDFYGIPPSTCYECPPSSKCGAEKLSVSSNTYLFPLSMAKTSPMQSQNSVLVRDKHSLPPWALPTDKDAKESFLQTESCIISLAATESNCLGLNLTFERGASLSDVLELFNSRSQSQCLLGSGGRLCSRCECELSSTHPTTYSSSSSSSSSSSCFYKSGFKCSRCSTTFTLSQSIPFVVGIVVVIFIILTIIMTIVLRSRRQVRNKRWEDLSLSKRIWYRLVDTSKSGLISILILFIQILVTLTHWDAFLIRTLAQSMNGDIEGVGLVCLFPSLLTNPLTSLALRLILPLMVSALAAVSVGCGHLLSLWIDHRSSSQSPSSSNFDSDFSFMDDSSSTSGLLKSTHNHNESRFVEYPALALVSSNTISILQFFYFGTSLAATEYFFSSVQSHTGLKYVQAHPWMLYDDAKSLRGLSIPWLIFVVIGFPITFVVFSWLIRHKPTSPNITSYIGSLFSRYRHRVFWWEIVNVMKKLTIALLVRGISAANPMQDVSITLSIIIPLAAQSAVRPWKRYLENVMDVIGSILLVLSLVSSDRSLPVVYLVLTLDGIYVVAMIVIIIHQLITCETEYQHLWNVTFGKAEILAEDFD